MNISGQQLVRLNKINFEEFYLLEKNHNNNKLIFKICGSTKNVYETKIYFKSRMIFCNCPDSKSWAKRHGVICKHCCFVLFKVLKISINREDYFKKLFFNETDIEEIKSKYEKINLNNLDQDFLKKEYLDKFKNINNKDSDNDNIVLKDKEEYCVICYDNFDYSKELSKKEIYQCDICKKILHLKCISKWCKMGHHNCPYCRSNVSLNNGNGDYLRL